MVNQDNSHEPLLAGYLQEGFESGQLPFAKAANGEKGETGPCRAKTDQRDLAANAQTGKAARRPGNILLPVGGQVGCPHGAGLAPGPAYIGFVVARDYRHLLRVSQPGQPLPGFGEFARQTEMRQVAGDGNMVRTDDPQIFKQGFDDFPGMDNPSFAPPRVVAQHTLAEQLRDRYVLQRSQMKIGEMRQGEAFGREGLLPLQGGRSGSGYGLSLYIHYQGSI